MTEPRLDVVIIGAPRSGTNMLRDVLTSVPGVATWPCDEINLIWRHGNRDEPSDELTPAMARPDVSDYIRRRFARIRRRNSAPVVVEKTCANSLRVGFVRAVLPHAKYVFITRDGVDAAASAMQRWNAPFEWTYTAKKARFIPASDLPHYGRRFLTSNVRGRSVPAPENATSGSTSWWGPKPHDWRNLMRDHPLDEVCALQWQRCVEASYSGLTGLSSDQLLHVSYEALVIDPATEVARLTDFLQLDGDPTPSVRDVSTKSLGKGRAALGPEAVERLESLIGQTLERVHG